MGDNMTDAPERIWATTATTENGWVNLWREDTRSDQQEYVRADLHAALLAENAKLREVLTVIRDVKPTVQRHFTGPSPEDEIDATVLESDFNYLQEIASDALAAYRNATGAA